MAVMIITAMVTILAPYVAALIVIIAIAWIATRWGNKEDPED